MNTLKVENWRLAGLRDQLNNSSWDLDTIQVQLEDLSIRGVETRVFIGDEKSPIIHKHAALIPTVQPELEEFVYKRGVVQFWITP